MMDEVNESPFGPDVIVDTTVDGGYARSWDMWTEGYAKLVDTQSELAEYLEKHAYGYLPDEKTRIEHFLELPVARNMPEKLREELVASGFTLPDSVELVKETESDEQIDREGNYA